MEGCLPLAFNCLHHLKTPAISEEGTKVLLREIRVLFGFEISWKLVMMGGGQRQTEMVLPTLSRA